MLHFKSDQRSRRVPSMLYLHLLQCFKHLESTRLRRLGKMFFHCCLDVQIDVQSELFESRHWKVYSVNLHREAYGLQSCGIAFAVWKHVFSQRWVKRTVHFLDCLVTCPWRVLERCEYMAGGSVRALSLFLFVIVLLVNQLRVRMQERYASNFTWEQPLEGVQMSIIRGEQGVYVLVSLLSSLTLVGYSNTLTFRHLLAIVSPLPRRLRPLHPN